MKGIITNISTEAKALQNIVAGTKIKYPDYEFRYFNFENHKIEALSLIATISDIKEANVNTIFFININHATTMEAGLMLILKKITDNTKIGLMFLLHSNKNELELHYFPLHLNQLFMFSQKIFSFAKDMKYREYKMP